MDDPGPGGFAAGQLRSFVERLERVNEERDELANDLRDIYAEAKANGFDVKVLRHVIKARSQDANARSEFETLADLYMAALGMLPGDPVEPLSRARAPAREGRAVSKPEEIGPKSSVAVAPTVVTSREEIAPPAAAHISSDEVRRLQAEREQWAPRAPEPEPEIPDFLRRPPPVRAPAETVLA